MRNSAYLFFYFLFAVLLPSSVTATDLKDHFIPFPGDRGKGGCDADTNKLQQGYKEAHQLVDKALESMTKLNKQRPHFQADKTKLSVSDKKDWDDWDRQARLLKTLFAIDTNPETGIALGKSQDRFREVAEKFTDIKTDVFGKEDTKWLLYCTHNFMTYIKYGEDTPWGEKYDDVVQGFLGAFVWKAFPPTHPENQVRDRMQGEPQDVELAFCAPGASQASTRPYDRHIYVCAEALDRDTVLGADYKITEGQDQPVTLSYILLHELVHVNRNEIIDVPKADKNPKTGKVQRLGKCYGYQACANLAFHVPDETTKTADTFALFALGVWLDKWDFAVANKIGKAVAVRIS